MPELNLSLRVLGFTNNQISLIEFDMSDQILCIEKINRCLRSCLIDTRISNNFFATSCLEYRNFLNEHLDGIDHLFTLQVLEKDDIFTIFKCPREVLEKVLHRMDAVCCELPEIGRGRFETILERRSG